jgi:acetyl esterase
VTDYAKLIDAETWTFIERTNAFYPPDTIDATIDGQRAIYDRMCREFHAGHPDGIMVETTAIGTATHRIPIRIYTPTVAAPVALVLYFHGGGFVVGGLESHDDVCAELAEGSGCTVVSVDYRLCPEHVHPAAFDDAMTAFRWAADTQALPVVLAGDSAGGNLAAAVAHHTRRDARAAVGRVLIYPGLGGDQSAGSYVTHAEAPMLSVRDIDFYRDIRAGGADIAGDVSFAPLFDTAFSGLPPTVVVTAQCDPLSSDGAAYRDRILAAGGKAVSFEEAGLVHGYLRARHTVGRARASFGRIVAATAALARGQWPY